MTDASRSSNQLAWARRLGIASRISLALWLTAWVAFGIALDAGRDDDLVSALAVVICVLFGLGFAFEAGARRLRARAFASLLDRADLVATGSRGIPRVR